MTTPNSVRLTYIGGPTLSIEFGGLTFLTDPTFDPAGGNYTTGPVTLSKTAGPALQASSLGHIDAVLLSHDHHFDNLDHAGRDLLSTANVVLTTPDGAQRLDGNAIGLTAWQEWQIPSPTDKVVRVFGTPARHGPENGDRGPVTGFVLQQEDEPQNAVYVSGDTVWYEGVEAIIQRFPGIRIAILFLGAARVSISPSHLTFTAEEAVHVARVLPNAVIVPLHYEGWKHFSESKEQIAHTFAQAGLENRLCWLNAGEPTDLPLPA